MATRTGDLAEIEGLDDRSPVIPLVTSTRDNCLGTECPSYRDCHVMRARRDAMAADLVVVNHHLFFADMALRDTGVAELLPTVDAAVFDEAHQLVETGVQFLGVQLGTSQLIDFARDLLAVGLTQARGLRAWPELAAACEHAARDLRLACAGPLRDVRGVDQAGMGRARRAASRSSRHSTRCTRRCSAWWMRWPTCWRRRRISARLSARAAELSQRAAVFAAPCPDGHVRWIDVGPRDARLDRVAAGHPRTAGRTARRCHAGVDLHVGHAGRRCRV